jgi:exodeoxyribonuclease-3
VSLAPETGGPPRDRAGFTLATWNVNSIRARLSRLLSWLERRRPDVVCLQETKVQDDAFPAFEIQALGYRVVAHGQKAYNGVAILSRDELADVRRGMEGVDDVQKRILCGTAHGIRIVNLYVPNGEKVTSPKYPLKLAWLEQFRAALDRFHRPDEPLLLCGDFNIAPEDRDVHDPKRWRGKVLCTEPEREQFRALIAWGLQDGIRRFTQEAGVYTWWDYRLLALERNWGLRIDHVLLSPPAAARLQEIVVDREERAGEKPSDHAPVIARFGPETAPVASPLGGAPPA